MTAQSADEDPPVTSGRPASPDGALEDVSSPDGGGRRRRWHDRRVVIGGGYVAIVAATAWLYGLVPFSGRTFPLAPVESVTSWVECFDDGYVTCPYLGYPEGVDPSIGLSLFGATFAATRLGIGVEVVLNLLAVLAVAAGVAALWALTASIARSTAAGAVAAAMYFLSPMIVVHSTKVGLWFGFVLLPVPLALAYAALTDEGPRQRRAIALAGSVFLAALVVVYLDPYAWAICMVLGALLCIAGGVAAVRRRGWRAGLVAAATLVGLLAPGMIFRVLEPSAEYSADFPLGFYRAYGVDVVSTVFPTREMLLGDLLRSPVERWDPADFYGDGTQFDGTFTGVFTLGAAAAGAYLLLRRRRANRLVVLGVGLGALASLALGLGPSLKVFDKATVPVATIGADGAVTGTDHVMPASEATLSLPWSWVYGIQPFEGMRTTYRWHVGLRLCLAIFAAAAVIHLFGRRRALGLALVAVLALEMTSWDLLDARDQAARNHELVTTFEDDMERAFGNGRLRASERVLFLPAENDYLIGGIAPPRRLLTYNLAFDKEMARIRPLQPTLVVDAITAYAAGTLDRGHLCELFGQDLVDAVVFTDFDMRRDTLIWPPPEEKIEARRAGNESLGLFDDPAFTVDDGYLATILRPARASQGGC